MPTVNPDDAARIDAVTNAVLGRRFAHQMPMWMLIDGTGPAVEFVVRHNGESYQFPCKDPNDVVGYIYDDTGPLRLVLRGETIPAGVEIDCPF